MANFEPCLHCDGNVTSDGPEPSARHDGLWCIGLETLEIRGVDLLEILASEKRVPAPSEQLTALQKCDEPLMQGPPTRPYPAVDCHLQNSAESLVKLTEQLDLLNSALSIFKLRLGLRPHRKLETVEFDFIDTAAS
ncbi:predicted protein [Histoplasma capsulatum H143]|uniref:Uncharacterized protein n=1 Tax=Ajellomyces capsulatus (strain H143) TaxID=544712 RepID=C6H9N7_AJECH|nr:predicted protein [Histoplasma capsulatum H143]